MATTPAVVGIADHIGWAELVTVCARDERPRVLDRRRVELVAPGTPSAPYHHESLVMDIADARALVERVRRSVDEHARACLEQLRAEHPVTAVVLRASPYERVPYELADVLSSYALTCAADGMLYREALADAAAELGLGVHRYPRKTSELALAAEALGLGVPEVEALVVDLGRDVGRPWRKEHKAATAAALSVLMSG